MRQGAFGKDTCKVLPQLNGLRVCVFHFYAIWLCAFVFLGIPTVGCVSNHHVDLYTKAQILTTM